MALLELAAIVLAFGAMALVFGVQERVEEQRILARNEAALARAVRGQILVLDEDDAEPHSASLEDVA